APVSSTKLIVTPAMPAPAPSVTRPDTLTCGVAVKSSPTAPSAAVRDGGANTQAGLAGGTREADPGWKPGWRQVPCASLGIAARTGRAPDGRENVTCTPATGVPSAAVMRPESANEK